MQSVHAEGAATAIGAMASVEIVGVGANSLTGRIVAAESCEHGAMLEKTFSA